MSSRPRYKKQGPELLVDLIDNAERVLKSQVDISPERAEDIAVKIADLMAQRWGGSLVYFPKGNWNGGSLRYFELAERDLIIYREYNGTNRQDICDRYGISSSHLYHIIAAVRRDRATRLPLPAPKVT